MTKFFIFLLSSLFCCDAVLLPVKRFHIRSISFVGPVLFENRLKDAWTIINDISPFFGHFNSQRYNVYKPLFDASECVDEYFLAERISEYLNTRHTTVVWFPDLFWNLYSISQKTEPAIQQSQPPHGHQSFIQYLQDRHLILTHRLQPNDCTLPLEAFAPALLDLTHLAYKSLKNIEHPLASAFSNEIIGINDCFSGDWDESHVQGDFYGAALDYNREHCSSVFVKALEFELNARKSNKIPLFYTHSNDDDLDVESYDDEDMLPKFATSLLTGFWKENSIYQKVMMGQGEEILGILIDKTWFMRRGKRHIKCVNSDGNSLKTGATIGIELGKNMAVAEDFLKKFVAIINDKVTLNKM